MVKISSMLGCFEPFRERHGDRTHFFWHCVALRQGLICGKTLASRGGFQPLNIFIYLYISLYRKDFMELPRPVFLLSYHHNPR